MQKYSKELKESIILKALSRGDASQSSIAKANNIAISTLSKWLHEYRNIGSAIKKSVITSSEVITTEAQFNHLLATTNMSDVSLGEYCRKHGIYPHQLTQWRESFMTNNADKNTNPLKNELKALKDKNKRLEQELKRKDKALAEASALLIMKKKANLIWGENEED